MTIHTHPGTPYGEVHLPVDGTAYIRAEDHEGQRYIAIQATGGQGVQVWQYDPTPRTWACILAPGQEAAWELREFYRLSDGRLILEAKPHDGHSDATQWLIWSPSGNGT